MKRFEPLDVFRGMTICFMIIVNTPGDWGNTFSLLLHAPWHGFTPTDLVFPSFLFAVGNAIGSNIANIGLVLGLTALIVPLKVQSTTDILRKHNYGNITSLGCHIDYYPTLMFAL